MWLTKLIFTSTPASNDKSLIPFPKADEEVPNASALGNGISDLSLDAGVEGKISLVSGKGSIYGTGIFKK